MKKIQIDYNTFIDMYRLLVSLNDYELENNIKELRKSLETQIEAKIDAMQKHNVYTQSKVGATPEEREKARQEYLDLAGIHKDWRYNVDSTDKIQYL